MSTINNLSPLVNGQGQKLSRKFLGKTENFEDKKEKKFYQKMLKYYCKGKTNMPNGFITNEKGVRLPNNAIVEQEYFYI